MTSPAAAAIPNGMPHPADLRVHSHDGTTFVTAGQMVIACRPEGDVAMRNLAVAVARQLGFSGQQVAQVTGLTDSYVASLRQRALREGAAGLVRPSGPKPKLSPQAWARAARWRPPGPARRRSPPGWASPRPRSAGTWPAPGSSSCRPASPAARASRRARSARGKDPRPRPRRSQSPHRSRRPRPLRRRRQRARLAPGGRVADHRWAGDLTRLYCRSSGRRRRARRVVAAGRRPRRQPRPAGQRAPHRRDPCPPGRGTRP